MSAPGSHIDEVHIAEDGVPYTNHADHSPSRKSGRSVEVSDLVAKFNTMSAPTPNTNKTHNANNQIPPTVLADHSSPEKSVQKSEISDMDSSDMQTDSRRSSVPSTIPTLTEGPSVRSSTHRLSSMLAFGTSPKLSQTDDEDQWADGVSSKLRNLDAAHLRSPDLSIGDASPDLVAHQFENGAGRDFSHESAGINSPERPSIAASKVNTKSPLRISQRPDAFDQSPEKPSFVDTTPGPSFIDNARLGQAPSPHSNDNNDDNEEASVRHHSINGAAYAQTTNAALVESDAAVGQTHLQNHGNSHGDNILSTLTWPSTQAPLKLRLVDPDGKLAKKQKRKINLQMYFFQICFVAANGLLLFWTWYFTRYWWAIIPVISLAVALNTIMVISLTIIRSWKRVKPTVRIVPDIPERMILLVPCYNENQEEVTRSMDSLIDQEKIDQHQQAILIICDGKVRGPGMDKTCADTLLEDVLTHKDSLQHFTGGYTACDQQPMDVTVQTGNYRGLPYICVIKQQNQGKRDSLIFVRSFLHYYNLRRSKPSTILSPELFDRMACWVADKARIDHVDALIGMDADTVLKEDAVYELIQEARHPNTLGVAGYIVVDWKDQPWSLWRLYQNTEYTVTQTLRRLHQGRATHKVSVLPGACQLLKITEDSCGDEVLIDHFGKKPDLDAGLYSSIMFSASEDGNHVCCMMTVKHHSQTRQALKSIAYTDVPMNWTVFLSQRRRWSLGASGNDWKLAFGNGILLFERILSFMNTLTWFITPFLFTAYASFIYVLVVHADIRILYFACLTFIPIIYYLTIPFWLLPGFKQKMQYWAGLVIYITLGPTMRVIVIVYTILHMTDFSWGKTRMVVAEDAPATETKAASASPEPNEKHEIAENKSASSPTTSNNTEKAIGNNQSGNARDVGDEEKRIGL